MSSQRVPGESLPAKQSPGTRIWDTIVLWVRTESAATQALIMALIALGIAFEWWHWSDAQTGAVVGIVSALLGMYVRSQVTPLIRPTAKGRPLEPVTGEPVIVEPVIVEPVIVETVTERRAGDPPVRE